jgi:hypothetical protein
MSGLRWLDDDGPATLAQPGAVLGSGASDMDVITLSAGDAGLRLAPAAGGAVTRYWTQRRTVVRDWLRPARVLSPGETLRAAITLTPELHEDDHA